MTDTTETTTEARDNEYPTVKMRHPDLGDVIDVPAYAVEVREAGGYEVVEDEEPDAAAPPVDQVKALDPPASVGKPGRQPGSTSGTATGPGSDGGTTATTAG